MAKRRNPDTVVNRYEQSYNRVLLYTIQGYTYTTWEYCLARGLIDPVVVLRISNRMERYAEDQDSDTRIISYLKMLVTRQLQTQEKEIKVQHNKTRDTSMPDDALTVADFYSKEPQDLEDIKTLEQEEALDTLMRKYVRVVERRNLARTTLQDAQLVFTNLEIEIAQMRCEMHKLLKPQANQVIHK